ncbi:transposase [Thermotoga maritima MSB8]|jgi:putative transposase|uniref:Transposase n=2 Tax=Thermotoga TaxID=2335 RepID=Q9S5X3_THEMA|nr:MULTISPECIES: IS200/IS605 family transposase [Thermotoga]AAD35859.1 transposase [Thermotoga maritima MSB8]ACB08510.1 transposase IS200-family protein [Thermotoga sp. RQ2]ADA66257.1 transposase IS200-family protein [Thermotoga petrophila RKU-10]ADA66671.1 transposase IS200-family protein [Thermotoga petrophila RKU-10]ADA67085.1 transposase IS200-family protein [Thermotoga petrophila RKU-10]
MHIKKTRWSHYNLNYHFVWIPKYRRKILVGSIAEELERILRNTAKQHGIEILALSIQPDHVHLFVSAPPRFSPAEIANLFKGVSARKLLEKFPELRTKEGLWARSYYVGTAGDVSEETIRRYIEECQDV